MFARVNNLAIGIVNQCLLDGVRAIRTIVRDDQGG